MQRLVLLDGHALLYRAFHAMPPFTSPDGRQSGAVYGFVNVVLRVLRELEPRYLIACFDAPGPTFRDKLYADYKATRAETPPDLITQEPITKEALAALAIPTFACPGWEADDIIATLVEQASPGDREKKRADNDENAKTEFEVDEIVIVTGDRDLLQLASQTVKIYLLRRGIKEIELIDGAGVESLMGLKPADILDWKALRGDPSDNIIGVPGIGDKTALALMREFGNLKNLYQAVRSQKSEVRIKVSLRDVLLANQDRVYLNRELLKLRNDAPVTLDLAGASRANYNPARARDYLAGLGFKGILARLPGTPTQKTLF